MDLEAMSLELARDPAPAGRRLDRDRSQLPLPLDRPVTEPLTRRLKPALAQLARLRVEHHRLKHPLVDIDACVQHLPGPPFVTEVGPRTYRGRWRPPPLHPHGCDPGGAPPEPGVRVHKLGPARRTARFCRRTRVCAPTRSSSVRSLRKARGCAAQRSTSTAMRKVAMTA